jgi:hypothetical protein
MENTVNLIPRAFYTSVPSSKKINSSLVENWNFIKNNNPGWTHVVFDSDSRRSFIESNYPREILRSYDRIHSSYGAARADYFRYLLLYINGGVWLDAKSTVVKPMAEILQSTDEFLLSQWTIDTTSEANKHFWGPRAKIPTKEYISWFIAVKPGHLFLEKVIEDVTQNINSYHPILHGVGGMGVLGTTGPLAYTRSIFPHLESASYRRIDLEQEKIVYTVFTEAFTHSGVIGSNYRKNVRPLVSRGMLVNSEILLTLIVMYSKKILNKIVQKGL